jgi:hypothetical protein
MYVYESVYVRRDPAFIPEPGAWFFLGVILIG